MIEISIDSKHNAINLSCIECFPTRLLSESRLYSIPPLVPLVSP